MPVEKIYIKWSAYGWTICVGNRRYSWDHNDDDMGVEAISTMLRDFGYEVHIKEDY